MSNELTKQMDMAEIAKSTKVDKEELAKQALDIPYAPIQLKVDHDKKAGNHEFFLKNGAIITSLGNSIDVIVVRPDPTRAWFKEEGMTAPTCASVRGIPTVSNPICEYCTACPNAEWMPGENSDIPPVCKESIRLFVSVRNPNDPEEWLGAIAYLSQTNIKPWNEFLRHITAHSVLAHQVLTRMTLDDVQKGSFRYAVTKFTPVSSLTEEQNDKVTEWQSQVKSFLISGGERDLAEGNVFDSGDENASTTQERPTQSETNSGSKDDSDLPF